MQLYSGAFKQYNHNMSLIISAHLSFDKGIILNYSTSLAIYVAVTLILEIPLVGLRLLSKTGHLMLCTDALDLNTELSNPKFGGNCQCGSHKNGIIIFQFF